MVFFYTLGELRNTVRSKDIRSEQNRDEEPDSQTQSSLFIFVISTNYFNGLLNIRRSEITKWSLLLNS